MKTYDEIAQRIIQLVVEISLGQTAKESVTVEQRIVADLGLDSLDYASMLLDCEQWMGIHIEESGVNWSQLATVESLARFLEKQQKE